MSLTTDEMILQFNKKFDDSGDLDKHMRSLGFEQSRININPNRVAYDRIGSDNMNGAFIYRDQGYPVILFFSTNAPVKKISTHANDKNSYTPYTLVRETVYNDNTRQAMAYVASYLGVDGKNIKSRTFISPHGEIKSQDFSNLAAKQIAIVLDHIADRYTFVFNTVKKRLQYIETPNVLPTQIADKDLIYFDDRKENSMWCDISQEIKLPKEMLSNILNSDAVPEYDPVDNYLSQLPEWDGVDYYQKILDTMDVEATLPQKWAYEYIKKFHLSWLSQLRRDSINNNILIMQGAQGIRKTRFLRALVPPELKNYYFEGRLNSQDKDSLLVLHQNILINLDEMDSFTYKELQFHKALITREEVDVRAPYNKYFDKNFKLCSFVGSTNDAEMLSDTTGNRRFNIIPVVDIDENFADALDHAQLWAQTLAAIKSGERTYFTTEESREISMVNRQFEKTSAIEELLLAKYVPAEADDLGTQELTATDIAAIIGENSTTKISSVAIGKYLRKYGYIRKMSDDGTYKWLVKPIIADVGF